jgi:hypothetical protein
MARALASIGLVEIKAMAGVEGRETVAIRVAIERPLLGIA